jgi:hypothetical protein
MDNKNKQLKMAMMYFASAQLQIQIIDSLKGTSMYRQKVKNISNKLIKELESDIDDLYSVDKMTDTAQVFFAKTCDAVDTFISAVENSDIDLFITLLKEFRDGNIAVMDGQKHKKILDQQKKLEPQASEIL